MILTLVNDSTFDFCPLYGFGASPFFLFMILWFYFYLLLFIIYIMIKFVMFSTIIIIGYNLLSRLSCTAPKTVFSSTNQNWIQKKISHLIINVKWKIIIVLFWTIWVHPLLVFYICYLWFNCDVIDSFF